MLRNRALITAGIVFVSTISGAVVLWRYYKRNRCKKSELKAKSILVVTNQDEWNHAYWLLSNDLVNAKVLGFDCEWVTRQGSREPVSLLQLATRSGLCVLVRLCSFTHPWPDSLSALLSDSTILKVGVACLDDAQKLLKDHSALCHGCVDLRNLAMRSRITDNTRLSLKGLSESVLGVTMNKDISVRCSDWQAGELTQEQINYAALDALAAVQIFFMLLELRRQDRERNSEVSYMPRTQQSGLELSHWSQLDVMSRCQGLIDMPFTHIGPASTKRSGKVASSVENHKNGITADMSMDGNDTKTCRAYVVRQKPLYHNCQLRSPDDQLLCTCDAKKANWYLEKGLGDKVCDDPLTVRLKFEPSGRPLDEKNYYLQEKDNVCVVCGRCDTYIRKCVIPHEYRKHFPAVMKEHKSHDVLLLCTACHRLSNSHDSRLKQLLAQRLIDDSSDEQLIETAAAVGGNKMSETEHYLTSVRSAAKALKSGDRGKIPDQRIQELEQLVCNYFGVSAVSEEILNEAFDLKIRCKRDASADHGKCVVDHVMQCEGLIEFEKMWRRHFLDTMRPRYMPALWAVDHSHQELSSMSQAFQQSAEQQDFES